MKKITLTDKRKNNYYYNEAIKNAAYEYSAVRPEHKDNSDHKLFSK